MNIVTRKSILSGILFWFVILSAILPPTFAQAQSENPGDPSATPGAPTNTEAETPSTSNETVTAEKASESSDNKSVNDASDGTAGPEENDQEEAALGWQIKVSVGATMVVSRNNETEEENEEGFNRGKPSEPEEVIVPVLSADIAYRFHRTSLFGINLSTTPSIYSTTSFFNPISFEEWSNLTLAVQLDPYEYWENPYLVGSKKNKRSNFSPKFILTLDNLGPFSLEYSSVSRSYDDSLINEVVTAVDGTTDINPEKLKRTGTISSLKISSGVPLYSTDSGFNLLLLASYLEETGKFEGRAVSYSDYGYSAGLQIGYNSFGITMIYQSSNKPYDEYDPFFMASRKDRNQTYVFTTNYNFNETYGVSLSVIQNQTDSNIDFYDSDSQIYTLALDLNF